MNVHLGMISPSSELRLLSNLITSLFRSDKFDRVIPPLGSRKCEIRACLSSSLICVRAHNCMYSFYLFITQISYASTSPDLSDTQKYDYLLRTVPSDVFQARAMVDLIRFLNWTTVYTVNSDTNYGERGMDAFKREAMKYNICILDGRKVDRFTTKKEYQAMLNRFAIEPGVRGVVTFMEMLFYHNLLNAAQTIGKADRFRWIASDAWGFMIPLKDGKKSAENTIVFTLHYPAKKMQDFYSYFWNLTKKSVDSSQNPWFAEFWNFYCDEIKKQNPKSSKCDLSKGTDNTKSCLKDDLHASHAACPMDDKVPYVMDAIYAFAHALKKLTDDRCPQKNSTQKKSCFQMLKVDTKTFFHEYLKKLTFQGITGNISFSEDNEDRGIYDINLFYNGVYEIIGQWDHGSLRNMKLIKEYMKRGSSSCGVKCPNDHIRQVKNNRQCCWTCSKCQQHQYISDIYTCKDCPKGQTPYFNRTDCYNLPVKYWADGWFGTIAFLASAGCCLTLFVTAVFIKFNYTPLIKASSREVSYTLLCGITLNYALTILIATGPTSITCGITKFGAGFTQSVCYAALLVKTSRLARIFSGTPDPIFITPNWQLILVALLILPQICIGIANLLINPPEITYNYDNPTYNLILCKGGTNDLIVAISYNLLLIALCTYYAFRTRKIPANFNEAKYIGFVMYTTCAVWLAFIPVFFSGSAGYTLVALSLNLIVNSTTILFGLFGLKVYIVLLRPEKNSMASSKVRLPSMLESSYSENGHGEYNFSFVWNKLFGTSCLHKWFAQHDTFRHFGSKVLFHRV